MTSRYPRSFHVVAKPIGSTCNLDCAYCYYHYKESSVHSARGTVPFSRQGEALPHQDEAGAANIGTVPVNGRITDDLLEKFIQQYISGQEDDPVVFNWHGGEPALLGLEFFRKVVELEHRHAEGHRIKNDFQTNGVLLDESWCEFFKEHDFYVGLSIDGPKHLHDQFRGGFDQVYKAAQLLRQYEVPFNALTVIHRVNAKHPAEVYHFLTEDLGCRVLQWLPCVGHKDFQSTAPGRWDRMPTIGTPEAKPGNGLVTDWSVDPDDWGDFLCQTFDLWLKDNVVVNWFESLMGQWMGQPAQICTLAPVCGRSLVTMEQDGSLYSCDHFVYPEYRLGHLDDGLADLVYSDQQRRFGCNKRDLLPDYCKRCKYRFACHGECPKNRFLRTPDGQPGLNYLCSGNRRFFAYADPHLQQIAATRHGSTTAFASAQMPGST